MTSSSKIPTTFPIAIPAHAAAARRGGPTDPSHDEELRRGILRTTVSRGLATFLGVAFLLVIYAVPIGQAIRDKVAGDESVLVDLFRHAPTKDNIKQFEEDLDKASTAREYVRPRMQALFARYGHFGNSKAVLGRDGWLFYAPGVTAVGGPGFLDGGIIASRKKVALDEGGPAVYPDPRPAILDFARFLAGRGIKLVLFPVPDKVSLQPRELHGRATDGTGVPPRNPDADRFAEEMRGAGVLVFDPTPARLAPGEPARFMHQDTHWTPAWMDSVAVALAHLLATAGLPPAPAASQRAWHVVAKPVTRVGDVTDMLGLPDGQTLFAPDTVTVEEVHDDKDALFEPADKAEVLLLGDSFTNVFSLDQMGWGEGAGLGAHLARALGRDVDVIAQNDSGAFATRQLLANALADAEPGGADRLTGKRVVVWEFASRELAVGNWKPVAWPAAEAKNGNGAGAGAGTRTGANSGTGRAAAKSIGRDGAGTGP